MGLRLRAPGRRRRAFCCCCPCSSTSTAAGSMGAAVSSSATAVTAAGRVRAFCCPGLLGLDILGRALLATVAGLWRPFCCCSSAAGLGASVVAGALTLDGLPCSPANLWVLVGLRRRPGAFLCGVGSVDAGGSTGVSACATGLLVVVGATGLGALGLGGLTLPERFSCLIPASSSALSAGFELRRSNMDIDFISGILPAAKATQASTSSDTTTSLIVDGS